MNISLLPQRTKQVASALPIRSPYGIGDRVRLDFRGKIHEVMIQNIVDEHTVVVSASTLLLPVACSRNELQPIGEDSSWSDE